jgi:hypothetical protein
VAPQQGFTGDLPPHAASPGSACAYLGRSGRLLGLGLGWRGLLGGGLQAGRGKAHEWQHEQRKSRRLTGAGNQAGCPRTGTRTNAGGHTDGAPSKHTLGLAAAAFLAGVACRWQSKRELSEGEGESEGHSCRESSQPTGGGCCYAAASNVGSSGWGSVAQQQAAPSLRPWAWLQQPSSAGRQARGGEGQEGGQVSEAGTPSRAPQQTHAGTTASSAAPQSRAPPQQECRQRDVQAGVNTADRQGKAGDRGAVPSASLSPAPPPPLPPWVLLASWLASWL